MRNSAAWAFCTTKRLGVMPPEHASKGPLLDAAGLNNIRRNGELIEVDRYLMFFCRNGMLVPPGRATRKTSR